VLNLGSKHALGGRGCENLMKLANLIVWWEIIRYTYRNMKNDYILCHFLLNEDIAQLWYELGHIHKKILFYEENAFFVSQLHNGIPKYLSIVQNFIRVPKYLTIAHFFAKFVSHFSV